MNLTSVVVSTGPHHQIQHGKLSVRGGAQESSAEATKDNAVGNQASPNTAAEAAKDNAVANQVSPNTAVEAAKDNAVANQVHPNSTVEATGGGSAILAEYGVPLAAFTKVDINHDGKITTAEVRSYLRKNPGTHQAETQGTVRAAAGGTSSSEPTAENLTAANSTAVNASTRSIETSGDGLAVATTSQAVDAYNKQGNDQVQPAVTPNGMPEQGMDVNV